MTTAHETLTAIVGKHEIRWMGAANVLFVMDGDEMVATQCWSFKKNHVEAEKQIAFNLARNYDSASWQASREDQKRVAALYA